MTELAFTVYAKAEPQGSMRARTIPGTNRAIVTSDNKRMMPFRSEVARTALATLEEGGHDTTGALFGKHVPVEIRIMATFAKPASARKRRYPAVKPDSDKVARSILDALTGIAFYDDAQVVILRVAKRYANFPSVEIVVSEVSE